ncbi:hydroxymethylglutaryl-CoA synthase [Guillardia theta CCMP2712]|uniref:Hydroxymethylglutaryl-CoA synthase n=1 Tax=Guillardia theta (strain CCMP2712) TaxID=905079 RepID=L1J7V6_GUITC|nr:hydroxymethylglutaryl-CoA synthase [Guillardia theta CCMP2712]EKX44618.1 hydroxymethylglutaryl-CoA synthase [Guillardia theta CCMP2712]|eukprot:XP_005831598.1 hydroxymethylglutaryl-CoA synthase [Guillardia theta CCMP2712]
MVGIIGMEIYFPRTAVRQSELEKFMGEKEGKFTIGLGQQNMAFCNDLEDINSVCMTAVANLLEKYNIAPTDIGRLEVGTETLIDKSKSVKTSLCQLFNSHGNFDLEGVDNINACYGGTAALLNTISWVESSAWDGRYGLVVCGDIAVYEEGPARPTGGCAAVAMLIGRDAPLAMGSIRASHMEDAYDFYKPKLDSEYPTVFGQESNVCYLRALDGCYRRFALKYESANKTPFNLGQVDSVVLHSPYNKLVKKSGARMLYNDFLRNPDLPIFKKNGEKRSWRRYLHTCSFPPLRYAAKVEPSVLLPQELGNSYTASMYTGLLSLIHNWHKPKAGAQVDTEEQAKGKRVLMFSYGSGLAATLYSIQVAGATGHIAQAANLEERLKERKFVSPQEFTETLKDRETKYGKFDWSPEGDPSELFPGTYRLTKVDKHGRRSYERVPVSPFREYTRAAYIDYSPGTLAGTTINFGKQA